MVKSTTSWFTLSDGHKVYEKTWECEASPTAHLVLLHGFSDQIDHYDNFFDILCSQYPIRVVGWDRRGWGKSVHKPSERGNTGPKAKQIADLNEYLNHVISAIPDIKATPVFLFGHSMGGQETVYFMLNTGSWPDDVRPKISGIVLESPYIGLDPATQPSALKVNAGKFACLFIPHLQIKNPVHVEYLSPDVAVQNMYKNDPLCHGLGTLEAFRDMLQREADLSALGKKPTSPPEGLKNALPCPALWTHGTVDKATDYPSSKQLCESLKPCGGKEEQKVFKAYDGWFHQLHNQPDGGKEQYAKDVGDWIIKTAAA